MSSVDTRVRSSVPFLLSHTNALVLTLDYPERFLTVREMARILSFPVRQIFFHLFTDDRNHNFRINAPSRARSRNSMANWRTRFRLSLRAQLRKKFLELCLLRILIRQKRNLRLSQEVSEFIDYLRYHLYTMDLGLVCILFHY